MLQKFKEHIAINFPFLKDKKLLVAISGGLDSVVLYHLFGALKDFKVSLAHCNFQLRKKESDLDEEFVINLSQKSSNQIFTKKFNTSLYAEENKISIQIAARKLRYNWFQELVIKYHFDYILTAHHADDNLETFLINFTRGSGLEGFTGIPEKNGNIIRPLLPFSRQDIRNYAKENNLEWREDASNASTKYLRNKIRHQVIPVLKEINPSLLDSFEKTTKNLQESKQIVDDRINDITNEIITSEKGTLKISIAELESLSNPKAYLYQLLKDYGFTEWDDVTSLLNAQSGKQIYSKTHRLLKNREFLILSKKIPLNKSEESYSINIFDVEIKNPIHLTFSETHQIFEEKNQTIYVDKDLLKYPLKVRKWKNGDYFYPTGMSGKKKVSKYFKDKKFSILDKENTWLLCDVDDTIIWIINHRQDRRFAGTPPTKNSIKISAKT